MKAQGYVICNPEGTAFFEMGDANSQYDDHLVTKRLWEATMFVDLKNAQVFLNSPKTVSYWGSKKLAAFFKTAIIRKVSMSLDPEDA